MAVNTALVVYANGSPIDVLRSYPVLDKPATRDLVERLFPGSTVEEIGDQLLLDALDPPQDVAYIGCFNNLDLVCGWGAVADRPSQLGDDVRHAADRDDVYLLAMHGDADWCMYGTWERDQLTRAYSVCPDPGVMEDIGAYLPFEQPFHDEDGPTDPMALGQAALRTFLGFSIGERETIDGVDPELIPMVGYRVTKPVDEETGIP